MTTATLTVDAAELAAIVTTVLRPAASGFAAPKLVTMRTPLRLAIGRSDAHAALEQRIEAGGRIGELAQLRERDGALGEAFERQVIELALRGEDHRRLEAIALESAARTKPDEFRDLIQAGSRRAW